MLSDRIPVALSAVAVIAVALASAGSPEHQERNFIPGVPAQPLIGSAAMSSLLSGPFAPLDKRAGTCTNGYGTCNGQSCDKCGSCCTGGCSNLPFAQCCSTAGWSCETGFECWKSNAFPNASPAVGCCPPTMTGCYDGKTWSCCQPGLTCSSTGQCVGTASVFVVTATIPSVSTVTRGATSTLVVTSANAGSTTTVTTTSTSTATNMNTIYQTTTVTKASNARRSGGDDNHLAKRLVTSTFTATSFGWSTILSTLTVTSTVQAGQVSLLTVTSTRLETTTVQGTTTMIVTSTVGGAIVTPSPPPASSTPGPSSSSSASSSSSPTTVAPGVPNSASFNPGPGTLTQAVLTLTSAGAVVTVTATPSPSPEPDNGLSTGAKAGIGAGAGAVGLAGIAGLLFFLLRRRNSNSGPSSSDQQPHAFVPGGGIAPQQQHQQPMTSPYSGARPFSEVSAQTATSPVVGGGGWAHEKSIAEVSSTSGATGPSRGASPGMTSISVSEMPDSPAQSSRVAELGDGHYAPMAYSHELPAARMADPPVELR